MKKTVALLLALTSLLTFAACDGDDMSEEEKQAKYEATQTDAPEIKDAEISDTETSEETEAIISTATVTSKVDYSNIGVAVLSDFVWSCDEQISEKDGEREVYYYTESITLEAIEDYVDILQSSGCTLTDHSTNDDSDTWSLFNSRSGAYAMITYSSDGSCSIFIVGNFYF